MGDTAKTRCGKIVSREDIKVWEDAGVLTQMIDPWEGPANMLKDWAEGLDGEELKKKHSIHPARNLDTIMTHCVSIGFGIYDKIPK